MLNTIKKYFKKVKKENSEESSIPSYDFLSQKLPRIWTGVDLDGTLAYYNRASSYERIGAPVPAMLALVKKMINNGIRVKIFTARVQDPEQVLIIQKWLKDNGLPELEITNVKDFNMQRLYDDRCIQVERNTGRLIVDN